MGCSGSSEIQPRHGQRGPVYGDEASPYDWRTSSTRDHHPQTVPYSTGGNFQSASSFDTATPERDALERFRWHDGQGRALERHAHKSDVSVRPPRHVQIDGPASGDEGQEDLVQDQYQQSSGEEQPSEEDTPDLPDFYLLEVDYPDDFPQKVDLLVYCWNNERYRFSSRQLSLISQQLENKKCEAQILQTSRPRRERGPKTAFHGKAGSGEMASRKRFEEDQNERSKRFASSPRDARRTR